MSKGNEMLMSPSLMKNGLPQYIENALYSIERGIFFFLVNGTFSSLEAIVLDLG